MLRIRAAETDIPALPGQSLQSHRPDLIRYLEVCQDCRVSLIDQLIAKGRTFVQREERRNQTFGGIQAAPKKIVPAPGLIQESSEMSDGKPFQFSAAGQGIRFESGNVFGAQADDLDRDAVARRSSIHDRENG